MYYKKWNKIIKIEILFLKILILKIIEIEVIWVYFKKRKNKLNHKKLMI